MHAATEAAIQAIYRSSLNLDSAERVGCFHASRPKHPTIARFLGKHDGACRPRLRHIPRVEKTGEKLSSSASLVASGTTCWKVFHDQRRGGPYTCNAGSCRGLCDTCRLHCVRVSAIERIERSADESTGRDATYTRAPMRVRPQFGLRACGRQPEREVHSMRNLFHRLPFLRRGLWKLVLHDRGH